MLSDYRRKDIYERWKSKEYLGHIGRLQTIMSKNSNSQGRLAKVRRNQQPRNVDSLAEKSAMNESQSGNFPLLPNLPRQPSLQALRRTSPKQHESAQLSILREKLLHVNSDYRRDLYQKNYKTTLRLLHNLRRKPLTSPKVDLNKLYVDSQYKSRCNPDRSYTHLCHNYQGKLYDQLFLKFERLPAGWSKYDLFSIQKVGRTGRKKRKPLLFSWGELQKDLFLFKLAYRDESRLQIQINRFAGNDWLPLGNFVVWRGRNQVCTITSRGGFDLGEFRCIAELMRMEKQVSLDGRNIIQQEHSSCCSKENNQDPSPAMFLAELGSFSNRQSSEQEFGDPFETDRS